MKRNIYKKLLEWKNDDYKKPLIVKGQRQVGKTYITREFAKNEYSDWVYINFLNNPQYNEIFDKSLEPKDVYNELNLLFDIKINQNTLLILDEFQESEKAIQFLKTLNESNYANNLIASGSWVEAAMFSKKISFPVGQVSIIDMYPMTIDEFITNAYGKKFVLEISESFNKKEPLSNAVHKKLISIYKEYLTIGGMPEVVNRYIQEKDNPNIFEYIDSRLSELSVGYINDLAKYGSNYNMIKMMSIYDSFAVNLNRPYNKFKYSLIKKGTQKRDWTIPIDFMIISQVTIPTYMVKKPLIPLEGNYDINYFKLYFSDIGFLINKTRIKRKNLYEDAFGYLGWITENYVAIHLNQYFNKLFYWYKEPNEIDFLINSSHGIIPIDVKSGRQKRSNSLIKFLNLYKPNSAIIISKDNFSFKKNFINIPIYAIFLLENI